MSLRRLLIAVLALLMLAGCPKEGAPQNSGSGTSTSKTSGPSGGSGGPCDATCAVAEDLKAALGEGAHPLDQVLGTLLDATTPNAEAIQLYIQRATTAERQAVLNNPALMQKLAAKLDDSQAVTAVSSLLVGSLKWQNPTANDFYDHYVTRGQNTPLPTTATMNCWESVIYASMLGGEINADWIRTFYDRAMRAPDPNASIWSQLGWRSTLPTYSATNQPKPGQLVFYYTPGSPYPGHVAISLGGDRVVSLWNQPNGSYQVQNIQIDQLGGTIQFGDPPW